MGNFPNQDPPSDIPQRAVDLAEDLLTASKACETPRDRRRAVQMSRMVKDSKGQRFTIRLADEVLRIPSPARAALKLTRLTGLLGVPAFLSGFERFLLRSGNKFAGWFPRLVMPLVQQKVRQDSADVILSAEHHPLKRYLDARKAQGVRVNLNLLGEAVLGEEEAQARLDATLNQLANPDVDYVSIKISAVFSQIHLIDEEETFERITDRLRTLYRAAIRYGNKFVNLDMEEYRDLDLTVDAFKTVLVEPEFMTLEAGIVLQAYLPDSYAVLQDLTGWAMTRYAASGTGIKIRIVKGANLAMEKVDASLHGWHLAPYDSKEEVDANYKRMLRYACDPMHATAVRVGVASHNLFDIAYALILRETAGVEAQVEFEMLEGMANAQSKVVHEQSGGMLVYAPTVKDAHFQSAIAYLVRRLDENSTPENFLYHLFDLEVGTEAWETQKEGFLNACRLSKDPELRSIPNRTQNRKIENHQPKQAADLFENAADTDFSVRSNREWLRDQLERYSMLDFSCPIDQGGREEVDSALATAVNAQRPWAARSASERADILRAAGAVIASQRGKTLICMQLMAKKAIAEGDSEISEAVDFANSYADALTDSWWQDGVRINPLGVVVVTPPWNFPYAIPAGGCLAALMAGNSVVLKPAPETVEVAWLLVQQLWEAGVPRDVLQFLNLSDNEVGKSLITDDRVGAVILTGSSETAQRFLEWKPELRLFAETSGKNAMIITEAADLDLAVKDLVKSAFGHSGQKCSATSIALIEAAVLDRPGFQRQLRDAADSLHVGPASDLGAVVTPTIQPPHPALLRALTTLEPGESWLVQPKQIGMDPCLWSPGIKLGVKRGSWFHRTECFGPVLGVIRVESLDEAIAIQNESAFGLTGGLHSLSDNEIARWKQTVQVGNAYINRTTTGAVVRRQPFGGWKRSSVGPGAKAGGPNYVASLASWENAGSTKESPQDVWEKEFSVAHDPMAVHGESNSFRYVPVECVILRVTKQVPDQVAFVRRACEIMGIPFEVSVAQALEEMGDNAQIETEEALLDRIGRATLRVIGEISEKSRIRCNREHRYVHDAPVVFNARIEFLHYLREQSVSETMHRYGNIS